MELKGSLNDKAVFILETRIASMSRVKKIIGMRYVSVRRLSCGVRRAVISVLGGLQDFK